MIEPPVKGSEAKFAPSFGQRSLLTVDTEEEFDWDGPFSASGHGLDHVPRLRKFQEFCEGIGVSPVYLIDWPIATSRGAMEILREPLAQGKAEVGIQLHPWVNPPFDEEVNPHNSYSGNLPPELEEKKFRNLRDEIEKNYGVAPQIYRAGRYGLGPETSRIMKDAGVPIDSSVRANFDYTPGGGPDYSKHPLDPYWVDEEKQLLELPLTTIYWGMLRKQGRALYPALARVPKMRGLASKLGLLERISLTPEGVTAEEALRGIDIAIDDQLPLLVLSFHSPSLAPGYTPYVHTEDDLDGLYDWWRRIYTYLDMRGVRPTTVKQIMQSVEI
ncbi:polysaccharide deacetylase family protein [Pontixanthobacter aestiaquae]|uniref:WalW protein n=1 Tax=Pontixanthobacter aestiaquae TaxID=1509367 RepID=A0A844Z7L1_9SPHN|nr:polysaccharide deacetylase family protein [Pontixanthobacter aestiaquae]MDN3645769.1 polysaccharide deacetylase family protein [Pontixanthobacter aestiaquae]MXO83236.1 WalW protein [Pontixanthobacter aestiaquae]